MNKAPMIISLLLTSLATTSIALADTEVTVNTPPVGPGAEIFVCNASRNFSDKDRGNPGNMTVSGGNGGKVLTPSSPFLAPLSSSWNQNITTLRFGLSMENYGASYDVYFCYRGPGKLQKIDPKTQKPDPKSPDMSEGLYRLGASISASVRDYADAANLTYAIEVTCDLRMSGGSTEARTANETDPGGVPERDFFASWGPYNFSSTQQISTGINGHVKQVPRFCMFKVTLTEKDSGPRPNGMNPGEFNVGLDIYN